MTDAPRPRPPARSDPRPHSGRQTLHLLLDLPVGVGLFTTAVALLGLGVGLSVTLVGIPLLAGTVLGFRAVGAFERARVELLLGHRLDGPPPFESRRPGSGPVAPTGLATLARALRDGPGWRGIAYSVLMVFWGTVAFTLCVVLWSLTLALLPFALVTALVLGAAGRAGGPRHRGRDGLAVIRIRRAALSALTAVDVALVTRLLGPGRVAELEQQVDRLTESRDASVSGAARELARLERDLHDGTQQRLVALAMELGLARDRLVNGDDPDKVLPLVTAAHDSSKAAISELRDLVRGVQPSVLTDRGLDAALSGLAARSPVPVRVDVDLPPGRPTPAVEAAAYYIVAEAITNAAKHAGASRVIVEVRRSADDLAVTIIDDGRGGAVAGPVGGLAGMWDRARAVEGHLAIDSPSGGPTVVTALLPCGS